MAELSGAHWLHLVISLNAIWSRWLLPLELLKEVGVVKLRARNLKQFEQTSSGCLMLLCSSAISIKEPYLWLKLKISGFLNLECSQKLKPFYVSHICLGEFLGFVEK